MYRIYFVLFPMQEFKYDLQDFGGEFHCTKAPPPKKKKKLVWSYLMNKTYIKLNKGWAVFMGAAC